MLRLAEKKKEMVSSGKRVHFGPSRGHLNSLPLCVGMEWFKNVGPVMIDDCHRSIQQTLVPPEKEAKFENHIPTEDSSKPSAELPLQVSSFWYTNQLRLENINASRSRVRLEKKCIEDENKQPIAMFRSKVHGTLDENLKELNNRMSLTNSAKVKDELKGVAAVASSLINFPVIMTQEAVALYNSAKFKSRKDSDLLNTPLKTAKDSVSFYEMLAKSLNVSQVYLNGRAFLVENSSEDVMSALERIQKICKQTEKPNRINEHVEKAIGETYRDCLTYMDTKRDRDVLKFIISRITSVKHAAKLGGVKNRDSIKGSRALVEEHLDKFKDISKVLESKYSNLSETQLKSIIRRRMDVEKVRQLKHIFVGNRGRKLKCSEFPDLAAVMEYEFGEADRVERGGGGMESHSKLKSEIMYRASNNATKMTEVRDILIAAADPGFSISLSSCYNYTMNYRKGTSQAMRHHDGKGINANVSLHIAPDTKAIKSLVINAHWCSANVNYILDNAAQNPQRFLVDSKDAKAVVRSQEKQKGKTWRKIELLDHNFHDESRKNAVTPMAHLFVKTVLSESIDRPIESLISEEIGIQIKDNKVERLLRVKRTGRGIFLINLSYYEPETVFRAMNELLYLMSIPAMDSFFRSGEDGQLPPNIVFSVDNGASEKPRSPLVQMCLVRLCRYLKRETVTQVSFAEYYSKRNIAERLNAAAQSGLESRAVFGEAVISDPGTEEHRAQMEVMAKEVGQAISSRSFGGYPILVFRGVGENFIFNDEQSLQAYLLLSEERKKNHSEEYQVEANEISRILHMAYGFDDDFKSTYREDYEILTNQYQDGRRSAWTDKYTTTIFNPLFDSHDRINMQPVPDYVRWYRTKGELHYLGYESRVAMNSSGIINETPEMFLPSAVLELASKVFRNPDAETIHDIALLSWCPIEEVTAHFQNMAAKSEKKYKDDLEKDRWRQCDQYKRNNCNELRQLCKEAGLNTEGQKHELVRRIAEYSGDESLTTAPYDGDVSSLPHDIKGMMRLSVGKLKEVMKFHGYETNEKKEMLSVRVLCIRAAEVHYMYRKEQRLLLERVIEFKRTLDKEMLHDETTQISFIRERQFHEEQMSENTSRPREKAGRPYRTSGSHLEVPLGVTLPSIFNSVEKKIRSMMNKKRSCSENVALFLRTGLHVIIRWKEDEEDKGWEAGECL